MSFATQEEVFRVGEEVLTATFEKFAPEGASVTAAPYPVISYKDAMLQFGSDKPDLRNPGCVSWMSQNSFRDVHSNLS